MKRKTERVKKKRIQLVPSVERTQVQEIFPYDLMENGANFGFSPL